MDFSTLRYLLLGLLPTLATAQAPADSMHQQRIFKLGEVTVYGKNDSTNAASRLRIEAYNRMDVGQALNLLPGVTLSAVGPRNESTVYVRGFDLRQVPVFIDGVPVYVPYDGYVDLGRFTTFDLAEINVSKGFTSVVYGPNTLGGAINLVSRKPTKSFDFDGRAGIMNGEGHRLNLNAGSKIGKFYIQASASRLKQNTYPLSKQFETKPLQETLNRDNAYRDDTKYSAKVGFTPNATDEYAISYVNQQGSKGTPPYIGTDTRQTARFWQWPYWNKESIYFISKTALSQTSYLKARLYYDTFTNLLSAFDNNTYSSQTRGSSFNSYYNDDTYGGSLELGKQLAKNHQLKASAHFKQDHHRENNASEPVRHVIDQTLSIGVEDFYTVNSKWLFVPGLSLNNHRSLQADNYSSTTKEITPFPANHSQALNAQAGLFFTPTNLEQWSLTAAKQTRFATIKDRYSYRMGSAIPNPDLKAESALHLEAAYRNQITSRVKAQGSLFYSRIQDVIQQVNNVQPNVYQLQNAGKAVFYGAEANLDVTITKDLQAGVQYTYLHRQNLSNPNLKFIDVPDHKVFIYAQAQILKRISWVISYEQNSARYSTSYGVRAGAFGVANTKAMVNVVKYVKIEGGVNNLFDANYTLAEGFPQPGRNFFVNLVLTNV